ncbi:hypothetical protein CJ030_MR5G015923 [Morella rubra]|uniref:Uncharacterized protein n=1 Tax=Morella rubra TaxID=262757 RepID=A0A6A1VJK1_9ROSI|nr:hypothetical protein CJ030_MR5G015923 [Morella rubra]
MTAGRRLNQEEATRSSFSQKTREMKLLKPTRKNTTHNKGPHDILSAVQNPKPTKTTTSNPDKAQKGCAREIHVRGSTRTVALAPEG